MKPLISYWYGLKHWMLTIFLAPLLLEVLFEVFNLDLSGVVADNYIFVLGSSAILALPTLLLYTLAFICCVKRLVEPAIIKIVLIGISVLGLAITIFLLFGPDIIDSLFFCAPYSITIILTGWLLPIQKKRID